MENREEKEFLALRVGEQWGDVLVRMGMV